MSSSLLPCIAVIAAGAMGSAVAKRLSQSGCTVLTHLEGRSDATRHRAREAGMEEATLSDISLRANWVLSILPPSHAFLFAEQFITAYRNSGAEPSSSPVFVDCNAVNPETVKRIRQLFSGTSIRFIDAGIIGGPPAEGYDPTIYAAADAKDESKLDAFVALSKYNLKISPLKGEGAGVGDASALKMSYAGITKGTTGLFTAMILAAHASSPATAEALLHELNESQPSILQRITRVVPSMLPKAYRWSGEMEEIAGFVGGEEGDIYKGLARLYERVERSVNDGAGDVDVLEEFVHKAHKTGEGQN